MSPVLRILTIVLTASALQPLTVMAADNYSPIGRWEVTSGESRFDVINCGKGQEICARLVWLRQDQRTAENLALMNKYLVTGAEPQSGQSWKGVVTVAGDVYAGTMTLRGRDQMVVRVCSGMFCQTYELNRR
jgi:uncharacterized protein (DUF2147 family)